MSVPRTTRIIPFKAYIVADTASAELAVDQAITDTATRTLGSVALYNPDGASSTSAKPKHGKITRISYQLNPTNAETYQLYILEGASADNYAQAAKAVYVSAALLADNTLYNDYNERAFLLDTAGVFPYIIDWSGAPGNTTGFIMVEGVFYE